MAGSFLSAVAFGYWVERMGSYNLALLPLAAMLVASGALFAFIDPSRELPRLRVSYADVPPAY